MNLAQAKALLPQIRDVLEMASDDWAESYDSARKVSQLCCRDKLTGEVYPIATIEPTISTDDREVLRKALIYIRAVLMLRDEAVRQYRQATGKQAQETATHPNTDSNRYARACAILSGKQKFRVYLSAVHGLDATDNERVNTRVRTILNVKSRTELDTDPDATQRWFSLVRDFEAWEKNQRPRAETAGPP